MYNFKRMIKRMACIDSMPLEAVLSVQAVLFGAFLILPDSAFLHVQVYRALSSIAPEEAWGIVFLALGISELVAIHFNWRRFRSSCAALALFMWLFVDLGSWISNVESAATVTYFTFVLIAMWSVISISTRDYSGCDD
jgi:hypothetical protein